MPEHLGRNESLLTEQLGVFYARVQNLLSPAVFSLLPIMLVSKKKSSVIGAKLSQKIIAPDIYVKRGQVSGGPSADWRLPLAVCALPERGWLRRIGT